MGPFCYFFMPPNEGGAYVSMRDFSPAFIPAVNAETISEVVICSTPVVTIRVAEVPTKVAMNVRTAEII